MIAVVICAICLLAAPASAERSFHWYSSVFDSIINVQSGPCAQIDAAGLEFSIDRARLHVDNGVLTILPPVAGKEFGCAIEGRGRFKMQAPTSVERLSLTRHTGSDSVDVVFNRCFMVASPEIVAGLVADSKRNHVSLSGKTKRFVRSTIDDFVRDEWNVGAVALAEIAGSAGTVVWLEIFPDVGKRLTFTYNSLDTEPTQLYVRRFRASGDYRELVMSCFPQSHYDSGLSWNYRERSCRSNPVKYTIETEITERADLLVKSEVRFVSLQDSLIALYALIFPETEIDSVVGDAEETLFFSKLKKEGGVTVFLNRSPSSGDTCRVTFFYHSDKIITKAPSGDFFIGDQVDWYPVLEYLQPALYDALFKHDKRLTLVSVGERVSDSVESDFAFSRWATEFPVTFTSFNYGLFDSLTITQQGLPAVEIYRGSSHRGGGLFGSDMKGNVASDIMGALSFYEAAFGEIPFRRIRVAEIPFSQGQGMPGLINLAWGTFDSEEPIWDALFRAHEVAHQWWGHLVRWDSYHDQWMSEAFAEFSAAMYVQSKLGDMSKYLDIVESWRRDATEKGPTTRGTWSDGVEAGPIWLGFRLSSSKSSDYTTVVYSKGAYVMHSLRCMMKDWATGSDDRFIAMMRGFTDSYRGMAATTNDFQAIVERHLGESMNWFFEQWIYGTDVPKLSCKHDVRQSGNDYYLDLTITQGNVAGNFKSVIPIRVDFGDDRWAVVSATAVGPETSTTVGPLPFSPRGVDFNFYKAVLSR
jgi:hypothetical protein